MRDRIFSATSSAPEFSGGGRRGSRDNRRRALRMSAVEFRANRLQLAVLEFADGAAPLLEEEPLEQIRRADALPVPEREAEMGDAGVEVLEEAVHQGRPLALVSLDEVVAQGAGQRGRGRFVAGSGTNRDLGPLPLGYFAAQVAQPMGQAPLPHRPRKVRLDGADQPRGAVGDSQQRIRQAPALEILEEGGAVWACPPSCPAPDGAAPSAPPR